MDEDGRYRQFSRKAFETTPCTTQTTSGLRVDIVNSAERLLRLAWAVLLDRVDQVDIVNSAERLLRPQ